MVTEIVTKITSIRRGLSKKETYLLSTLSEKKIYIFEIKDIIVELNCSYNYAKVIANRLVKKKWVLVLEKGKYLIVPLEAGAESIYTEDEFAIASELVKPYYIAYWSAMNYHGMTEQVPFTIFIASTKRRKNKTIHDIRYEFIALTKRKFFGFSAVNISGKTSLISDKEKTIADCLDHPEYCGGIAEVAKALWNAKKDIDFKKLINYIMRMNNRAILKRLGYLIHKLEINISEDIDKELKDNISKGYAVLDTMKIKKGKYSSGWKLLINISDKELLEFKVVH